MTDTPTESAPPARGEASGVPNRAFQSVIDHVPGVWFFARQDGTLAYANRGAAASLGYTQEELAALTVFDIDPALTPEFWNLLWSETAPGDGRSLCTRHRRKDGSEYPVEVRAARVYVDGADLSVSYTVDLTSNQLTQRLNRRLLAAIGQASEAVVVTDAAGAIEYVNPAYRESTGKREAEVIGRAWASLELAEDSAFLAQLASAFERGSGFHGRAEGRKADGSRYTEDISVSPIRDDESKLVGWVAVKRDITERLRLEQRLRQTQKVEAVGQLAGGIAHDLNNLLQVILGQAHLIQVSSMDASIPPMVGQIEKAVERATSLIRQLLAFSRKGTVDFTEVRLDGLLTALLGMLTRLLGEQIELEWANEAGVVYVRGNAPQLEQLVTNLCINARDAMPNGGKLELRLAHPERSELVGLGRELDPEHSVVLSVRDNGTGMNQEVRERMFEPFFTTKEPGRGTGLGLATVHAIAQSHQGSIDVTTELDQGSTFRIYLPTIQAVEPARVAPVKRRTVGGKGRVVLVAEDEPGVRRFTSSYLEQAGFRVLCAPDGLEAERLLAEHCESVALLVLDAVMPRKGGQAVHEGYCELVGRDFPTVFVTGYDYESLALAQRRANVVILQKPFSGVELLAHVAIVLGEGD